MEIRKETLDEIIERLTWECKAEKKKQTEESGTEQFSEMVEKYQRETFDDDNR